MSDRELPDAFAKLRLIRRRRTRDYGLFQRETERLGKPEEGTRGLIRLATLISKINAAEA